MSAMSNGREASRAVYMSSPLRFCTTMHAFSRVLPRYYIDPWKKDPQAFHRWKFRKSRLSKRGSMYYKDGPLTGVNIPGWPDPGLLGATGIASEALRAQESDLQAPEYWRQLAERTRKLRDVVSSTDIATILDTLVSADHRHLDLMKTLARELTDDADKLSFVEVAVVANAYAHFNCHSKPLLAALGQHAVRLISGEPGMGYGATGVDADPRSLAVFLKAMAKCNYKSDELLTAVGIAVVDHVQSLTFADISELLVAFQALGHSFNGSENFWAQCVEKVKGSRMGSLCPALLALSRLEHPPPDVRAAVVAEMVQRLETSGVSDPPAPEPAGFALADSFDLPAFAAPSVPEGLLGLALADSTAPAQPVVKDKDFGLLSGGDAAEADVVEWGGGAAVAGDALDFVVPGEATPEPAQLKPRGFYNPVSRRPWDKASGGGYAPFNASDTFSRNSRGSLMADSLGGLNALWRRDAEGSAERVGAEEAVVELAAPVIRSTLHGLTPGQLASCAEVYVLHSKSAGSSGASVETIRAIVREGVRKLSNFSAVDMCRLHDAAEAAGVEDPYLARARRRRFPKALRNHLRDRPEGSAQAFPTSTH